ncbi:MAG: hypothetical protein ACYCSQ_01550 [bacterium]
MNIDNLMVGLKRRIKSYILSFKPKIIDGKTFKYHVYYIAFYKEIQKVKQRYDISKTKMIEAISYAVQSAIAELMDKNIYTRTKGGHDMLFLNAACQ